ncbi:hypothetical protein D3C72_2015640 [compost metagenome]
MIASMRRFSPPKWKVRWLERYSATAWVGMYSRCSSSGRIGLAISSMKLRMKRHWAVSAMASRLKGSRTLAGASKRVVSSTQIGRSSWKRAEQTTVPTAGRSSATQVSGSKEP